MNLLGFLFLCVITVVAAKNIQFEPCEGVVKSVDVSPCTTEPCEIPKGEGVVKSVDVSPCTTEPCEIPKGEGVVKSVDVSPCTTEPCEIPKGGSVDITVRCLSNVNAEKLRLSVYAEIAGIEVPYPGMKRDACRGKNLTCPITKGQEIMFIQSFPVKKFFPTIATVARFNLKTNDDQDKNICCFKAPVKVVDSVH